MCMPVWLCYSFIHSFIPAISIAPLQVLYHSEALPTTARILYLSFTPSAQATAGKGLAQGPYVTARAGVEPTTLRLKVIDSTKAPSRPTLCLYLFMPLTIFVRVCLSVGLRSPVCMTFYVCR